MTTSTDFYVAARDARIALAMQIFKKSAYGFPDAKKTTIVILFGGLGMFVVAPLAMILSTTVGFALFCFGCTFFVLGLTMSIVVEYVSNLDIKSAFQVADYDNPEFIAIMQEHKRGRTLEKWGTDML